MENGIRPPIQMAVDSMRNLRLGNQGEQNAQLIRIDVSKWLEKWPGAGIDLMLALPGEKASYPAKTLLQDGELLFLPGFGDTQKAGHGAAYVVATLNATHVAVSDTVLTEILPKGRDGDTLPEAPEAQAGWVADVLDAATRAEEAAERAENAGGGTITDEQIKEAVDEYLTENPISDERLDKIASFFDLTEPVRSNNLLNPDTLVRGYYLTNTGTVSENSVYVYTDYIAVEEGDPVSVQKTESNYRSYYGIGFISAYDAAKNLLPDKGATSVTHYFTVPAGVSYLRLSFSMISPNNSGMTDWAIVKSAEIIPYEPYGIIGEEPHLKASAYTHIRNGYSVAVGNEWTANEENHDICGWNMVYKANIPTGLTGSVSVGKGYNGYQGGYITVTPTTVTFYKGEAPEASEAVSHGLTLKDYIYVGIAVDYSGGGKIRVATNGGKFDTEIDWASVRKGRFFVKDTNAETTDGRFAYTCHGWGAKTHMYGDSYFGVHNPGRWPYHLVQDGYTDVLINGFSGRNSADALRALKSVLEYSERPERIIWALGMNDPDADGAPNASWLACIKELMTICEDKAIELILTTTPLVEPVENTYKNEYVRNSRYRYIDFASAVGASSDTTWFDNMVYSDGVHPEVQGAAALYFQALADVPELMY